MIRHTIYGIRYTEQGSVLILTFIIMTTLTAFTVAFLYMTSTQLKGSGYDLASSKALWLAEAGIQKAIWNLKTPIANGGQGEDWTTSGTAESFGDGNYTMMVERWDFALASNGASASASSESGSHVAANAIDGSDSTYWQSESRPTPGNPEEIIVAFPYTLTINKVRFLAPPALIQAVPRSIRGVGRNPSPARPILLRAVPRDYSWQVSSDGVSYTTVSSRTNNNSNDVTDTFTAAVGVNYLKLEITKMRGGSGGIKIATLETIGSKITSTGTVGILNRRIEQTVVVDDATETTFGEKDWDEIPVI